MVFWGEEHPAKCPKKKKLKIEAKLSKSTWHELHWSLLKTILVSNFSFCLSLLLLFWPHSSIWTWHFLIFPFLSMHSLFLHIFVLILSINFQVNELEGNSCWSVSLSLDQGSQFDILLRKELLYYDIQPVWVDAFYLEAPGKLHSWSGLYYLICNWAF